MKVNLLLTLKKWLFIIALFVIYGLNTVSANGSLLINESTDIYQSEKYQNDNKNIGNRLNPFLAQQKFLSDDFSSKNDFESIARINLHYEDLDSPIVFDSSPIDWSIAKQDRKDWIVQNKEIISNKNVLNKPLAIQLTTPSFSDQLKSLRDYDELWIDYKYKDDWVVCDISASLDIIGIPLSSKKNLDTEKARWSAFSGKGSKTTILTVDARKSKWIKKDYTYHLSKMLGSSPDSHWRYIQDGQKVVVQRRMHWPVNKFSSLLVKYSNLSEIASASILVRFEDKYGGGELVTIPLPESGIFSNGDFGVELDIGQAIADAFPEKMTVSQIKGNSQQAYLQEVFFHFNDIDGTDSDADVSYVDSFLDTKVLQSVSLMERTFRNTNNVNNLTKAASSDAVNSTWKEISFTHGIEQLFGSTKGIESWNWQQTSNGIEVKKTLNWMFRSNSKLAIYVEPGTVIPSISLQFGTKQKKGLIKTIYDPFVSTLTDGKSAVLLDLDNLVVDQLLLSMNDDGEIVQPILNNINISLVGSDEDIITNRKLRAVVLFEKASFLDNIEDLGFVLQTHHYPLLSRTEKVGSQREREILELSELARESLDMVMNYGVLHIDIPDKESNCQIEIDSIRLTSTIKTKKPRYLSSVEKWNKKYGGNFLDYAPRLDLIEGMKFLAYSSPGSFYKYKVNYEKITNIPVDGTGEVLVDQITTTTTNTPIVAVDNYLNDIIKGKWLSVDGVELTSSGHIISTKPYYSSKQLESNLLGGYEYTEKDQHIKTTEYLEMVREKTGLSDYKISKKYNINQLNLSAYSLGKAALSETHALLFANIIGIKPDKVVADSKNEEIILTGNASPQGVHINGENGSVSLFWPTETKLDKQSMFYLSILKGEENIHSIYLKINGKNGEKWQKLIKANEPELLTNTPIDIDSVEIKFNFNKFVFDFVLGELAIVSPIMLNREEVFMSEIPLKDVQLLESGLSSVGVEQLGKLSDDNISFWSEEIDSGWIEALVSNPAFWTERISIGYQIPREWLGVDGCILEGDFIFANQTLHRLFCLSQASATGSFSAGELGLIGQEKLEKIVWRLQKPKGRNGQVKLNTWINTRGMSSVYNQIQHTPIFYLNKKPYYLINDNIQEKTYLNRFWSSLPQSFLNDYIENPSLLKMNNNPWFEVERIAVKPREGMSLDRWLSFNKTIEFEKAYNLLKLIGFVLFALLVIIVFRKGWLLNILTTISSNIRPIPWKLPQKLEEQFFKFELNLSLWIYSIIAILFVYVLIWASINTNNVLETYTLLASAMYLFVVLVYRHYRGHNSLEKRPNNKINPVVFGTSIFIFMPLLIADLQNLRNQSYLIVPVLTALYGLSPEIVRNTISLYRASKELLEVVIWAAVALVLYIVGFITGVILGDNYYFTFGGIAVVMTWRALLLYLKPSLESRWPELSNKVFGGAGTKYFSGFIIAIVVAAVMLILKLEPIKEQLAVICYYMLVVGVVLEILDLRKDKPNINQENSVDK